MNLDSVIDNIFPISSAAKEKLKLYFNEVSYPKNHLLLKANKIENNIFFLKTGLARAFFETENDEITFWFGVEGDPILSMKNYIENKPSYDNIELLENSELYKISHNDLQKLYNNNLEIANWGRKLAEKELVKTEERLISRQLGKAKDRYEELLSNHPDLLQRVALSHIASYLGITQVSLSRIRAEIR